MSKEKKKFITKCPHCNQEIIGFSEHHAKMNLMIHDKASSTCQRIRQILKKKGLQ